MSKPDDSDSTTHGFYSSDGMRRLSAEAQFDSDWNLRLTKEQEELLAEYGPVFKPAFDGHVQTGGIEVFRKPCPPHLRRQLDEALGRDRRIRAQHNMTDDLLLAAGFKLTSRVLYESWKVEEVIAHYRAEKDAAVAPTTPTIPTKPPGPEAATRGKAEKTMRDQLANRKLTEEALAKMTEREGAETFDVSRETFREARKRVLNSDQLRPSDQITPTNSDQAGN
jgi:hypothetical protein